MYHCLETPGRNKMSFNNYYDLIYRLIERVKESGFKPDCVLGVVRGGYVPAEAMSRAFGIPLALIRSSSYHHGIKTNSPVFSETLGVIDGRVLIVDDLVDTGETLIALKGLVMANPLVKEVKTAVIWAKQDDIADFHVVRAPRGEWIHQPMDLFERIAL